MPQTGAYQTARTRACLYQVPPCSQGPQGWYRVSTRSCTHIGLCFCWGTLSWGEPTAFVVCSKWTCSWSGRETLSHLSRLFAAHGTLRNSLGAERAGPCIFGYLAGRVGAKETDGMCLTTIMPCNFCPFLCGKKEMIKYKALLATSQSKRHDVGVRKQIRNKRKWSMLDNQENENGRKIWTTSFYFFWELTSYYGTSGCG